MTIINLNATVKCKDHNGYKAQSVKEPMWYLNKWQGDVVNCMTPEGPSDDFEWHIVLTSWFSGEEYVLKTPVRGRIRSESYEDEDHVWYENGRNRADSLIEAMKAKGEINLDNWTKSNTFA